MIIPAGHKVLVKPTEVPKKVGMIELVVDEKRELAATTDGIVVAIGETAYLKVDDGRPWVKVGDQIKFAKYAGAMVEDPTTKEKFVVIHDVDVVAIIKEQGEQNV